MLLPSWIEIRRGRTDGIEPSLYGFILRYSAREQFILVILTAASFPILYYSLELPKTIINHAIGGRQFPQAFLGIELSQIPYLLTLCGAYLALIVANGLVKFYINMRKGQLGERMLRELRYDLYLRTLRFPLQQFSRTPSGQIITMMTAELEPVAGFVGDAFALPVFQGGTLATIVVFLFVQNPLLGVAAVLLYPIQGYAIPRLQRKVRQLGRERIRNIRDLADRFGESIGARIEIRTNDDIAYQLADISNRLLRIYRIRYEVYYRKFFAKFLNNFLTQLTPFFFYALGGYFVIAGDLSFGALVAVLAAYKDMSDPWKELLNFYQDQQDVAIKYEQVVHQFDAPNMLDLPILLARPATWPDLGGDIVATNLTYRDADGVLRLEGATFSIPSTAHVAIVGSATSGKAELAILLARLEAPSLGRIAIGTTDLASLPVSVLGRWIGYVGPTSYLFNTTIRENLLVGLRHRLPSAAESLSSAPSAEIDLGADWIDYDQAGVPGPAELTGRIMEVIRLVGLEDDLYEFGLHGRVDVTRHPEVVPRFVEARHRLAAALSAADVRGVVERWDPNRFNREATISENLLFGTATGTALLPENLPRHPYVRRVLEETSIRPDLLRLGAEAAEIMADAFVDGDATLAEEFGLISRQDLPELQAVWRRSEGKRLSTLAEDDQQQLLSLAFRIVQARHRLDAFTDDLAERIVRARHRFAAELPDAMRGAVSFFDDDRYNTGVSLYDNLLFGKLSGNAADSRGIVRKFGSKIADELQLRQMIVEVGLGHSVGTGGSRLSPEQRQKAALARAVLKRPGLLILNQSLTALDRASQVKLVDALRAEFSARRLICVLANAGFARSFDQVLIVRGGRVVEAGSPTELSGPGSELTKLLGPT